MSACSIDVRVMGILIEVEIVVLVKWRRVFKVFSIFIKVGVD